ncbi:MAG: ATP synthase archaeal subunit H [ANME-2 cluster archaeon]|nr:ATP synthase archaeal subunit H [ANME-2 cluster archaeon]MDF1532498.1 ATP synthase archaeal subunit H [ANME-2 cluster archaeon]MDW7775143.1 ATP synthase archaeal subunit H [Methanosarcinales archaeon]
MTKAEILSQIKKAEEDSESIISQANELKTKRIQDAKNQSRVLIENAQKDSQMIGEKKIAQAKTGIVSDKEKLLKEGFDIAESIKSKAKKNLPKATENLMEQFERAVHA